MCAVEEQTLPSSGHFETVQKQYKKVKVGNSVENMFS